MTGILITDIDSKLITPQVFGKTSDAGSLIYQKVLVLLLSSKYSTYRSGSGTDLVQLLSGANTPDDALLTTLGSAACADVRASLDKQDLAQIQSLTAVGQDGHLSIYLTMKQGTTYTGVLL